MWASKVCTLHFESHTFDIYNNTDNITCAEYPVAHIKPCKSITEQVFTIHVYKADMPQMCKP